MCVAVVGSRKLSSYGTWASRAVSRKLAGAGVTVVSGMAKGADTCAHKGALEEKGNTIAVLGCGLDITYPASNRELKEEIARKGLLISEYPYGYPATKFTFPRRNRIISGLACATVIAEAGNNSGSLITAGFASEQGRSVYVIPANINNPSALGGNMLIRDGAMPLVILDDLLDDLGITRGLGEEMMAGLGEDEKSVLGLIIQSGEITDDEICDRLPLAPERINGILTVLEMKGIICSALGKIFLAK
jgi:DNA processing protein